MALFDDVLLTVDFDHTLTALDATIPVRNLEAIRYFMENGGAFTVNTGRSIPMSLHNILGIVPHNAPLLLYNGSAAYDEETGELTRYVPLDLDPETILPFLQKKFPALNVEVQALDAHYLMRKDVGWEEYCDHNQCPWKYADPVKIPGPFIKFSFYGEFRENTVASMYQATEEELRQFDEMTAYMEAHFGDKVEIFRACARIADVHAKGVSKLRSARDLQKELGITYLFISHNLDLDWHHVDVLPYAPCKVGAL